MEALTGCYSYDGLFRHFTDLSGFFLGTPLEAVTDYYPYGNLFRHCIKYVGFFLGTPLEAITDCYPYGSLFRHCVKYAGFFPGTPMEAITDCYLHEAFSGIVHVRGVLSVFFSEDCQQIFTRFLYESTSYGFALT